MRVLFLSVIYLMFFFSGAAALMYEVVWVRSLGLVFGGSHLAVTAVLSIFMGGLAIGSYILGKYADRIERPLRFYGFLELGIAAFAVIFAGLMRVYPSVYTLLAQGKDHSTLYLSFIRAVFAIVALIIPTTLMGGTLPVLTRFASGRFRRLGTQLSFLYGLNTLGAVTGTAAAGFFFLRFFSVSTTLKVAILINALIGVTSILLQKRAAEVLDLSETEEHSIILEDQTIPETSQPQTNRTLSLRLVLWGIGISGFCALGYEVLWTRVLTIVVGASVYGFTTMLVAFLTGIALGSKAYGFYARTGHATERRVERSVFGFGVVQVLIGLTALAVTYFIRDLPGVSLRLREYFQQMNLNVFQLQQWTNLTLAFCYMVVPAFFMGVAFPLAGGVHAEYRRRIGSAVGEILAYNTVGAILGAALSGFVMAYLFSIERSLQMFTVINIGFGVLVIASLMRKKFLFWAVGGLVPAVLVFMALFPNVFKMWNTKYFAIFRANQPEIFRTPEAVKEALDNTDVLYYREGVEAIVSSIKIKGGSQAFVTNGRVEASDNAGDLQVQYTLGHLPMLLNRSPRNVLVVGLGSGMTLGATSVHPSVKRVVLLELEPAMLGVAKTFERYNHNVLENQKLEIIFNDGRNFLLTTNDKFDVITADPIHPWFRGAGYLYTTEYFRLASEHLNEGGIMCQWLPIYEMTVENLKSVVKTFQVSFKHTVLWLTYYDSVIVGSNSPIPLDEKDLERRVNDVPAISEDLKRVMMGSADDFLSYFAMGTGGMRSFGEKGIINTDDNLYLEFSAPLNIGKSSLMKENLNALVQHREDILSYLVPEEDGHARQKQANKWKERREATDQYDRAHALFLGGEHDKPEFQALAEELSKRYLWYGPWRFLNEEYDLIVAREPRLLRKKPLFLVNEEGKVVKMELSFVLTRISREMVVLDIVENDARVIYGHFDIPGRDTDDQIGRLVDEVMFSIAEIYKKESASAAAHGMIYPPADLTLRKIKEIIETMGKTGGSPLTS